MGFVDSGLPALPRKAMPQQTGGSALPSPSSAGRSYGLITLLRRNHDAGFHYRRRISRNAVWTSLCHASGGYYFAQPNGR